MSNCDSVPVTRGAGYTHACIRPLYQVDNPSSVGHDVSARLRRAKHGVILRRTKAPNQSELDATEFNLAVPHQTSGQDFGLSKNTVEYLLERQLY